MKKGNTHIVPLSRQAVEVLQALHAMTGEGEYLFPHDRDAKKHMSNGAILGALRRMGYQGTMTGHGFRGLASTILNEQGYNHDWIEMQLSHIDKDKVRAAYNAAQYLEQRAHMIQEWSDHLDQIQRGKVLSYGRGAS